MSQPFDAIVLGAGAAGMFCAALAGQRDKRVLLLDHNEEPGRKILISGGGRCNFTNMHTAPERFLSANPHFAKSALSRYTPQDFLGLIEAYGIAWHEKTLGQLFCDGSARQVVDLLLAECAKGGVELRLGKTSVRSNTATASSMSVAQPLRPWSSRPAGLRSPSLAPAGWLTIWPASSA